MEPKKCPTCGQNEPQKYQVRLLRDCAGSYDHWHRKGSLLEYSEADAGSAWIVTGHGTGFRVRLGIDAELVGPPRETPRNR